MSQDTFNHNSEFGGRQVGDAALTWMMLESVQKAASESDYEFAFEYVLAVLSVEKSRAAAITLISVSLSLIGKFDSSSSTTELRSRFEARTNRLITLSFERLAATIGALQRRELVNLARRLAGSSDQPISRSSRECIAEVLGAVRLLLEDDAKRKRELAHIPPDWGLVELSEAAFASASDRAELSRILMAQTIQEVREVRLPLLGLFYSETRSTTRTVRPSDISHPLMYDGWIDIPIHFTLHQAVERFGDRLLAFEKIVSHRRHLLLGWKLRSNSRILVRALLRDD